MANFLSRPILTGFFAGISLSILIGQIERITGVDIQASGLVGPIVELVSKFGSTQWPTLVLALSMFALLQAARLWRFPVPGPVLVVVISVALALGAAAIFLVSFGSGVVTAQSFGAKGGYSVDPNRELIAHS